MNAFKSECKLAENAMK